MKPGQNPKDSVVVVVPNLNAGEGLNRCLASLETQTLKPQIIMVDNASTDNSLELIRHGHPSVEVIQNSRNRGFAGGVNPGIKKAMSAGAKYVATFNDDAVASKDWLEKLVDHLEANPDTGIVASKILDRSGKSIDSTGEFYTSWGLAYPRGRRETDINAYDHQTHIFAASGGASLYRVSMLKAIGLFDEDFFAYYEDVDLSFRARLAGWEVSYVPTAIVWHQIGVTSGKMPGFVTKQTLRNLPLIIVKNLPLGLWPTVIPRFGLAYWGIFFSAISQGNFVPAAVGLVHSLILLPKKLIERHTISTNRKLTTAEVSLLLTRDLPPDALRLRKLRSTWWQLLGKKDDR